MKFVYFDSAVGVFPQLALLMVLMNFRTDRMEILNI